MKGIESAVAVTRSASLVFDCDVISIYFRYSNWDKQPAADTPRVYHFARLISVRDGKAAELWADGRKCPALGEALKSLAVIEPPRIEIPGYTQPATGPLRIQIDGDGFRLSDRLGPEFSGNQASPLGQWTYATLKSLAPCLSAQKPSFG